MGFLSSRLFAIGDETGFFFLFTTEVCAKLKKTLLNDDKKNDTMFVILLKKDAIKDMDKIFLSGNPGKLLDIKKNVQLFIFVFSLENMF